MPFRNWIKYIAFGIALSLATPVFGQEEPKPELPPETAQEQAEQQPAVEVEQTPPASITAPTEPPEEKHNARTAPDAGGESADYLVWGDGFAQWVMAGTGIAALIISAWAVWLLKATLAATRDAVRAADDAVLETRRIGEAQVRAYVSVGVKIKSAGILPDGKEHFNLEVTCKNLGQSLGWVTIRMAAVVTDNPANISEESFHSLIPETSILPHSDGTTVITMVGFPTEVTQQVRDSKLRMAIAFRGTYRDVFGQTHDINTGFMTTGSLLDGNVLMSENSQLKDRTQKD